MISAFGRLILFAILIFAIIKYQPASYAQGQVLNSTTTPGIAATSIQGPPGFGATNLPIGANIQSTSIGFSSQSGFAAAAYGANAVAGDKATAIGSGATAVGSANALGFGSQAMGQNSLAVGNQTTALTVGSSAIGHKATASGATSTALGSFSVASGSNSIAIGAGSVATQANTLSIGAVGSERRIVNVAPGIAGTDAVDVNQLDSAVAGLSPSNPAIEQQTLSQANSYSNQVGVRVLSQANSYTNQQVAQGVVTSENYTNQQVAQGVSYSSNYTNAVASQLHSQLGQEMNTIKQGANQGVAAAVAMLGTIRTPDPGKSTINLGGGYYGGQAAVALSMAHRSRNAKWQSTAAIGIPTSIVSGANIAAAAGIGFQF